MANLRTGHSSQTVTTHEKRTGAGDIEVELPTPPSQLHNLPMCHRFNQKVNLRVVSDLVDATDRSTETEKTKDLFPLADMLVVRTDQDGDRELVTCNWGLLPFWFKPSTKHKTYKSFQRMTFNARGETIHEKPSYREAFKSKRCLIPWTEFFEHGWYFNVAETEVSTFAGLWQNWKDPESDQTFETCTIITCPANALVEKYHPKKRMPVILNDEESRRRWLDPDVVERPAIDDLISAFPDDQMEHWNAEQ